MATLKEDHDSWAAGGIIRRDFRHSHDGPEEMPHKKRGRDKTKKRYKGCPERDGRAHVYVWIEYFGKEWRMVEGGHLKSHEVHWYDRICVGCGHKNNRIYDWGWYYHRRSVPPEKVYEVRHVEEGYW